MPSHFTQSPKPIAATSNSPILQQNNHEVSTTASQPIDLASIYTQPQEVEFPTTNTESMSHNQKKTLDREKIYFKTLYPQLKFDNQKQEYYRVINEILGFKNPNNRTKVKVRAWKEGKKAYLFTNETSSENVVIYAHGSYERKNPKIITLTEHSPTITVFGPDEHILRASLSIPNILKKPYAEISLQGITAFSQHDKDNLNRYQGYQKITGIDAPKAIKSYNLDKFSLFNKISDRISNFQEIIAMNIVKLKQENNPHDIYTIRKKGNGVSARKLVKKAKKRGYKKILFFFCRSDSSNRPKKIYNLCSEHKSLEKPFFKSWEEIIKSDQNEKIKQKQQGRPFKKRKNSYSAEKQDNRRKKIKTDE